MSTSLIDYTREIFVMNLGIIYEFLRAKYNPPIYLSPY